MIFDTNQEAPEAPEASEGEGESETSVETVAVPKSEWEKSQRTIGSLKRQVKDLSKPKDDTPAPKEQSDDSAADARFERIAFKQAGITHDEDKELARKTAKKWGMDLDEVLEDDDFKVKLEKQQSNRANVDATSNIQGDSGKGTVQAKHTAEYWIAKGTPPTADQVSDGKVRAKIMRAMMAHQKSGGQFYNS
jgi:hypothetical protein